jgi:predicted MFS family arabinose efflux permease
VAPTWGGGLPLICVAALCLGVAIEIMMVQWTVALTRNIPQDKLARVFAYDAVGSVLAMPAGALAVGPIAGLIGVSATQYGAAAVIVVAAAFALIPRDVRMMRTGALPRQQTRAVASSGT